MAVTVDTEDAEVAEEITVEEATIEEDVADKFVPDPREVC